MKMKVSHKSKTSGILKSGRLFYWPGSAVNRPNRNAAGISYTMVRHTSYKRTDLENALARIGTLDSLGRAGAIAERTTCPCCGTKRGGPYRLRPEMQGRLKRARERAVIREIEREYARAAGRGEMVPCV